MNEEWCVATVDAVESIEDRRVYDGPEPLTGGVRRVRGNQRVDEDLVPLEHGAGEDRPFGSRASGVNWSMNENGQPGEEAGGSRSEGCGFHGISLHST